MIKTKRVEIHTCDLCDNELLEVIRCGICDREACAYHRVPCFLTAEDRPIWHPYFKYLCLECVGHYQIRDICDLITKIKTLTAEVHCKVVGDEMGKLITEKNE